MSMLWCVYEGTVANMVGPRQFDFVLRTGKHEDGVSGGISSGVAATAQ